MLCREHTADTHTHMRTRYIRIAWSPVYKLVLTAAAAALSMLEAEHVAVAVQPSTVAVAAACTQYVAPSGATMLMPLPALCCYYADSALYYT